MKPPQDRKAQDDAQRQQSEATSEPAEKGYQKPQLEKHEGWQILTLQQSITIDFPPLS